MAFNLISGELCSYEAYFFKRFLSSDDIEDGEPKSKKYIKENGAVLYNTNAYMYCISCSEYSRTPPIGLLFSVFHLQVFFYNRSYYNVCSIYIACNKRILLHVRVCVWVCAARSVVIIWTEHPMLKLKIRKRMAEKKSITK